MSSLEKKSRIGIINDCRIVKQTKWVWVPFASCCWTWTGCWLECPQSSPHQELLSPSSIAHQITSLQQLKALHQEEASANADKSDVAAQSNKHKCYLRIPKQDPCTDPTQLGFYLPKWTNFLNDCKAETHTYTAIHEPWPCSKFTMISFISDVVNMTITKWKRERQTVEKGYYLWYRAHMCKLVHILPSLSTFTFCWPP